MNPGNRHAVFVYGTLLEGEGNNLLLQRGDAELLGQATTSVSDLHGPGWTLVDLGPFPALLRGREPQALTGIRGEVYLVDDLTLARLDRLEGVPTLYTREILDVRMDDECHTRQVYGYVMRRETATLHGDRVIADGDWRAHRARSR